MGGGGSTSPVSHPSWISWIARECSFHGDGRGVREQTETGELLRPRLRTAHCHHHLILLAKASHVVKLKVKDEEVHSAINEAWIRCREG